MLQQAKIIDKQPQMRTPKDWKKFLADEKNAERVRPCSYICPAQLDPSVGPGHGSLQSLPSELVVVVLLWQVKDLVTGYINKYEVRKKSG